MRRHARGATPFTRFGPAEYAARGRGLGVVAVEVFEDPDGEYLAWRPEHSDQVYYISDSYELLEHYYDLNDPSALRTDERLGKGRVIRVTVRELRSRRAA